MITRSLLERSSPAVLAIAVVFAGCSGDSAAEENTADEVLDEPIARDDAVATSVPTTAPETTTAPAAEPAETGTPFMESWGLPAVVQLTPVTGAGQRPLFEWEPVAGAAGYSLFVYTPDGVPYWSWAGTDSSTYLGGAVQIDDDKPGPRLSEGMSWVVSAVDASSQRIAVSELRWVSP